MVNLLQQLNEEMAAVSQDVQRSLVQISNGRGAGAGTIWHADGLIITNAHVIHGHHNLNVLLPDGVTVPARVLAQDDELDLASLSVEASGLPTIELGDSKHLKAGEWVLAHGHPWGVMKAGSAGRVIGGGGE